MKCTSTARRTYRDEGPDGAACEGFPCIWIACGGSKRRRAGERRKSGSQEVK